MKNLSINYTLYIDMNYTYEKFSCNLQCNSILKRCKFVTNVWYVKNRFANCDETQNVLIKKFKHSNLA